MPVIEFTKVDGPNGWLGNMYASPIRFEDRVWLTSEALFQALRFNNDEIREIIRNEKSPLSAKMKAKSFRNQLIVQPMSEQDVAHMRMVVRLKFDQHPDLKTRLLETGDYTIVENIGNRNGERHLFWGMKNVNGTWLGTNMMGRILMELRDEYRAAEN
jgi:ribA/ribD-fused uncharacterized protein